MRTRLFSRIGPYVLPIIVLVSDGHALAELAGPASARVQAARVAGMTRAESGIRTVRGPMRIVGMRPARMLRRTVATQHPSSSAARFGVTFSSLFGILIMCPRCAPSLRDDRQCAPSDNPCQVACSCSRCTERLDPLACVVEDDVDEHARLARPGGALGGREGRDALGARPVQPP